MPLVSAAFTDLSHLINVFCSSRISSLRKWQVAYMQALKKNTAHLLIIERMLKGLDEEAQSNERCNCWQMLTKHSALCHKMTYNVIG